MSCFAIGAWTSIALAYRLRPPPSALVWGFGIACVALIGLTLFWMRVALMFGRSREYWRARAWDATSPEARPAWWSEVPPHR